MTMRKDKKKAEVIFVGQPGVFISEILDENYDEEWVAVPSVLSELPYMYEYEVGKAQGEYTMVFCIPITHFLGDGSYRTLSHRAFAERRAMEIERLLKEWWGTPAGKPSVMVEYLSTNGHIYDNFTSAVDAMELSCE